MEKRCIMTDAKVGEILQKMTQKFLISEIFYIFALSKITHFTE